MGLRPATPARPDTPDLPPPQQQFPTPAAHINQQHESFLSSEKSPSKFGMWQRLQHRIFGKDESTNEFDQIGGLAGPVEDAAALPLDTTNLGPRERSSVRPVGVGLPRQTTFKRQKSEERTRLCPIDPGPTKKRAYSSARPGVTSLARLRSHSSPATNHVMRSSAPALTTAVADQGSPVGSPEITQSALESIPGPSEGVPAPPMAARGSSRPPSIASSHESYERQRCQLDDRTQLNAELDTKWILNLSMHFRDKSDREKFFITYAQSPSKWRRVTVSCDYRGAEDGSLEMDLKQLTLQRDKSLQIYESIRDSLSEIQFYDTVTNLKLQTSDGRLHVHVTEDVNEIIPYPPRNSVGHVLQDATYRPMECRESDLTFDAHLSGFVYRVRYRDRLFIKKEIPGPDTVDEFLYEVNALHALCTSSHVIRLEGLVFDDSYSIVKGLLISFAERGALVDLLYDHKGEIPWQDRETWARHAVAGLSEIHGEGYVQGDFTLSNVVVDAENNAKIIDINRRGCPVGWEPPELAKKIASNQRISMYIGEKSDLYQLGMSLWALAMDDDEPERHDPPLSTDEFPSDVPVWFQDIVRICLSPQPRDRLPAKELLAMFRDGPTLPSFPSGMEDSKIHRRLEKLYIDPSAAVERDDIERLGRWQPDSHSLQGSPRSSQNDPTFTFPYSSTNYDHDVGSASSEVERFRGRPRVSPHELSMQAGYIPAGELPAAPSLYEDNHRIITIDPNEMDLYSDSEDGSPQQRPAHGRHERLAMPNIVSRLLSPDAPGEHLRLRQPLFAEEEFRGRSPPSEWTPRNSSIHISNVHVPREDVDHEECPAQRVQPSPRVEDDLVHLGSNPRIDACQLATRSPAMMAEDVAQDSDIALLGSDNSVDTSVESSNSSHTLVPSTCGDTQGK